MSNIVLKNVCKSYDKEHYAVQDFSLEIPDREFVIFVGPSGCGKSTTLRMIAGLEEITSGELWIDGQLCNYVEAKDRDLSMVFQNYALYPHMSVEENMAWGLKIRGMGKQQIAERVKEAARILELDGLLKRRPRELSGGQRQRVCIARALAMNPEIIIADESVSALDVSVRAQIINLLLALQKEFRIAFLFISHDMAVIERVCHRVAVMYLGQIVELGSRRDVFENPLHPYTKRLMSAVPIPDPSRRTMSHTLLTGEIPSPVRSADYEPVVAPLKEVSPGHFVSEEQVANWF